MGVLSEGREWGVGSVVVDFRVFGAPRFSVQRSKDAYFEGFCGLWTEKGGAPKTRKSTTTDPTPILGPLILGGGQKVYVEKVYVLFRSPRLSRRGLSLGVEQQTLLRIGKGALVETPSLTTLDVSGVPCFQCV